MDGRQSAREGWHELVGRVSLTFTSSPNKDGQHTRMVYHYIVSSFRIVVTYVPNFTLTWNMSRLTFNLCHECFPVYLSVTVYLFRLLKAYYQREEVLNQISQESTSIGTCTGMTRAGRVG